MANTQLKTIEEFVRFQNALSTYHVIQLGFQLGVVRLLTAGQKTSTQVAAELKLDPWKTELLCSALCETGLLERYDDDFALSAMGRLVVDDDIDVKYRGALESFVADSSQFSRDTIATVLQNHEWTQTPAAMNAAEVLDIGRTRRGFRILEIGGGAAVFSSAFAHRDPDCQVTLIDTAENLQKSMTTVDSIGIAGQFETLVGDVLNPQPPAGAFDLIVTVGLLHDLSEAACAGWVAKLVAGLKPEGELALIDCFHGQAKGARSMAFFELEMTLQSPGARLHRPPVIRDWMLDAGLENIQFAYLPSVPHLWGLVLGQKPR
jgi:protein-L-isoaspartate O-methyltransferase